MLPLNYHHLYYFWMTAKAGRISRACQILLLSQSALSMQLQQLERSLAKKLLFRSRKGVSLTPEGRIAFEYCERIFSQGEELAAALQSGDDAAPPRLRLGIANPISRHVVSQILERVYRMAPRLRVGIMGGAHEDLRDRLEKHRLDLVVSNTDFSSQLGVEFRSRLVGTIPIQFVAVPKLGERIVRFPSDLSKLPMLLMAPENPVRKEVDLFLCRHEITVSVEAEIEDFDLLRLLALRGQGIAAVDALTVRQDVERGRLTKLHRKPLGLKEYVWFICGRHPKPNPILHRAMHELMEEFSIEA
ncbi:MAG: LysR family transcriptional regulator [Elusimicrobia bacterium]|nr:LysR family transcriptional regulator [Elusimicrobiota bacterium]